MSLPLPPGTRPVASAHRLDEAKLVAYLKQHVAGFTDSSPTIRQFSHGQSNPTYFIQTCDGKRFVLRKKPPGKLLPSAHAVEREYRILTALRGSRVPVPNTYCLCEDSSVIGTPFYVMEYIQGRIFKDLRSLKALSRGDRFAIYHAMNEVLAELHKLDYKRLGLEGFGKTENYVGRQVSRWARQYAASRTEDIPAMQKLQKWLEENQPRDDDSRLVSIVHGDYRLDNLVFHPTQNRVVAVLDWELSTLGHPTADVAYNCMPYYLEPRTEMFPGLKGLDLSKLGLPSQAEYLQAYHRNVRRLGPLNNYRYFVALSFFRMAAIGQGVYKRSLMGNASSLNAKVFGELTKQIAQVGVDVTQAVSLTEPRTLSLVDKATLLPFKMSDRFWDLRAKLLDFMDEYIYPNELLYKTQHERMFKATGNRWQVPPIIEELKKKAKQQGLWNLFLTRSSHHNLGPGLTNLEYAPLCEIMGRSLMLAPEVFNCSAPDTGNMEVFAMFGSKAQQDEWLVPLMNGDIRSCYAMTEPLVASSDATNIECRIERDGDWYLINGRKWWTSGAMDPRCKVAVLLGKTDPTASTHKQQSMIVVPMDTPGVRIVRHLDVFGYDDAPHGHAEVEFVNVRVPASNLLLGEGRGFEIAQGRLGPGRIHHCMRLIGICERVMEVFCRRVQTRSTFGTSIANHGTIIADLAKSRVQLNQARLLTLQAAAMMDTVGNKVARQQIAMIKVAAPNTALDIIDRAIQAHGGMGVCQDTMLAALWAQARTLRLADGPDEVHMRTIARLELKQSKL